MRTEKGMKVQISVPSPKKHSSFANAFNGHVGTVVGKTEGRYGKYDIISLKVSQGKLGIQEIWINVSPEWLRRPRMSG